MSDRDENKRGSLIDINHIPDELSDLSEDRDISSAADIRKLRRTVKKIRSNILKSLKDNYGTSISRETSSPAMQKIVDMFSAKKTSSNRIMKLISERNSKYNERFRPLTAYAGKQAGGGPCDMLMFGLFRMSFNGCEVIATYNALKYLNLFTDIRQIASDFEKKGALLFGGFGVRTDAVASYMEYKTGHKVSSYGPDRSDEYDELFKSGRTAIFTFWNGPKRWTVHTVMLCHLKDDRVRAFNFYSNRLYTNFPSIAEMCEWGDERLVPISLIVI